MGGFACEELACAVTEAGGLGMIGAVDDMQALHDRLSKAGERLDRVNDLLPIGVGVLLFITNQERAIATLQKHKPAVVWFFAAPELDDYAEWAEKVRSALPQSQIWIQVGSVAAALQVAEKAKPDVLCAQGGDAGGHGFEKGAGVISLVPEISDAFVARGHRIALVAAGGIVDGRGVAAASMLGAQGVVLGTRFLAAKETVIHPTYQKAVLSTSDGGQTTTRSKLFDNLRGPNVWPLAYDGRSLVIESFQDHERGVDIEEIRQKHNEAVQREDRGFAEGGKGRAAIWAGTGVGMVREVQSAGEIVEHIRNEASKLLANAAGR